MYYTNVSSVVRSEKRERIAKGRAAYQKESALMIFVSASNDQCADTVGYRWVNWIAGRDSQPFL